MRPRLSADVYSGKGGDHLFICGIRNLGFLWGVVLIIEEVCNLWEHGGHVVGFSLVVRHINKCTSSRGPSRILFRRSTQ